MTVRHPTPAVIAAYLKRIASLIEHRGDQAITTARLLADRGYPTGNSAGGGRSSDTTSSTERAALDGSAWTDVDATVALALRGVWHHATEVEHAFAKVLAHASDDDPLPVGRGHCQACTHFCKGDGENDRLRDGLCHACKSAKTRYLRRNPYATHSDFVTARKRDQRDHGASRDNSTSATLTR